MSLASGDTEIGLGRVLLAGPDRNGGLIDRQVELINEAEQASRLAAALDRRLDGIGDGSNSLGPDRACRAF
jgi:hypothetical protein